MKALEQIARDDFASYEAMRQSGKYNMLDPRAQKLSGLDKETYRAVLRHYSELAQKWPEIIWLRNGRKLSK